MEDDGDDKDDSKRRTRNISEKKRRDQFNFLVNELSTMVSGSNRKMDKSTVLKSTISFLKNHNEITVRSRVHDIQEDWKPAFLTNVEFTYLVLEALEGFVMVFSVSGQIHYVSESIKALLGYNVGDLLNKSIFDLTFEEDRPKLYNLLQNPRIAADSMQRVGQDNEIRFQCHLRRGTLDFRDESTYELIDFNGHFRANTEEPDSEEMYHRAHESRLLFVCTGRLSTPQLIRDVSLADSSRSEFTSRHSLEWKFLFLDHRAPPIIGYLPFEVLGTSGYDYYHFDDLEKLVSCHESLMQKGELTSCYYRFLTKGQQWIWLQSRFYITYHQWNSKPEFVVCTHRVVNNPDLAKSAKEEVGDAGACDDGALAPAIKEQVDDTISVMSPTYMSDASEAFASSCQARSQKGASVLSGSAASTICTAATAGTAGSAWRYAHASDTASRYQPGSDTASVSGSSRSSQRNSREPSKLGSAAVPQWSLAPHLEPAPYVSADMGAMTVGALTAVGAMRALPAPAVQGVLSLPSLPILVAPDQAQIQDQLQQKHEKLQQMIVRQQEELRQVKEQLLLARLGILQPLPNVPNSYTGNEIEEAPHVPTEVVYEDQTGRPLFAPYPPQPPPNPHLPQ